MKSECCLVMTTDTQQSESMIYLFYLFDSLSIGSLIFYFLVLAPSDRFFFFLPGQTGEEVSK